MVLINRFVITEKALKIHAELSTKNRRALAELHYKIGLTYLMQQLNKEGAKALRNSSELIEEEIAEIKAKENPTEREKNNMLDLEETRQEILVKIQEIEETQAQVRGIYTSMMTIDYIQFLFIDYCRSTRRPGQLY